MDCVQAMELLVEKCVSSGGPNMSPGDALRRIFECISSGIILPGEFICFPWPFQHGGEGGGGGWVKYKKMTVLLKRKDD